MDDMNKRLMDLEVRLNRLESADASRDYRAYKPRLDWKAVAAVALALAGFASFVIYYVTQHKGLH